MSELKWMVFRCDWNTGMEEVNIFDHARLREDLEKAARLYGGVGRPLKGSIPGGDKGKFAERVRRDLMYYYWSKCEHEVVVTSWPACLPEVGKTMEQKTWERFCKMSKKVDIYDQVRMNWDRFIDYLWERRRKLLRKEKK